ncbi:MAG: AMP-binding protein, partial [Mycobacterium sp.]
MDRGIGQWVTKRAFLSGQRTAFVSGDTNFTFAEFEQRTNQVASNLMRLGVRKGDRVAVLLVNSVEFMEVLLGCAKIGAITIPINVRLAGPEIGYILADAGADVFVFHHPLAAAAVSA